jgi:hypothetical protein
VGAVAAAAPARFCHLDRVRQGSKASWDITGSTVWATPQSLYHPPCPLLISNPLDLLQKTSRDNRKKGSHPKSRSLHRSPIPNIENVRSTVTKYGFAHRGQGVGTFNLNPSLYSATVVDLSLMSYPEQANKYLLDPLTAPEPSQETGPGSRLISSAPGSRATSGSRASAPFRHPVRDSKGPVGNSYPTPPSSASPSQSSFHPSNPFASSSYRQAAFGGYSNSAAPGGKSTEERTVESAKGRRRGSSLGERFPGDMSHRPLDQLRKEAKTAHRSPHLRKNHLPGADMIDSLDRSMGPAYHHEGPYDATLISRNANLKNPPVEAVRESNIEALKATPRENIRDALDKHVPLQGTAIIPPGMTGYDGKPMEYEEGADLMRETDAPGGAYKRWPGMVCHRFIHSFSNC